jgi:hypothetical protein
MSMNGPPWGASEQARRDATPLAPGWKPVTHDFDLNVDIDEWARRTLRWWRVPMNL